MFVGGVNVTARIGEGHAACVLRDLGLALADLRPKSTGKAIVRFYDEPWEMCVERVRAYALVSVYRSGSAPEVALFDARVSWSDVVGSTLEALAVVASGLSRSVPESDLELARRALESAPDAAWDAEPALVEEDAPLSSIELDAASPLSFASEFSLRAKDGSAAATVEHADLHGLLFSGRVRAMVRGRTVEVGDAHPFLFAERLLELSRRAVTAWEHGQPLHVREEAGGVLLGLRLSSGGDLMLSLGTPARPASARPEKRASYTFPALSVVDVAHATLAFGRSLVRAVLRRDRGQAGNLRLSAFRRALRETEARVRGITKGDACKNPAPEPYRAFALGARASSKPPVGALAAMAPTPSRLRYTPRWRALVPGIDLRSTFLCGDRLVVGATMETFCLDRATGEVHWRVPTRRATSVVTPTGIARLHADGELSVLDYASGEVTMRTRLLPRTGAPAAGAVVSTRGLPRLLIVTEGERHMVAVDLLNGEPRWRFPHEHAGALRLKRHGKLLYITSATSALSALDVTSGSVVWRVRDRLRFTGAPVVDHDLLLAVAGGTSGKTTLYAVDAFSGEERWTAAVPGPDAEGNLSFGSPEVGRATTVEGAPLLASRVVMLTVRDRHGVRIAAFDRETGALAWASDSTVAPVGTSWLVVDDVLLGNTPTGELLGIDVGTGALRYRHVLGRQLEADVPRRLEPVLRSGAVFVPHTDIRIFRPSDGTSLGSVGPCEAIPDMLRVDEKCDVFVAEESGHMAAFGAGARLSLVR